MRTTSPPSRALAGAAALLAVETVALLAGFCYLAVELVVATPHDFGGAVFVLVLTGLAAGGLGLAARGLWRGRRAARAPGLLTQLLLLPVGIGLVQDGVVGWGVPMLVVAGAATVLLLAPSTGAGLH